MTEQVGPLQAGAVVAERYRVESPLAQGGMGAVYVARDEKLDQRVALKIAGGVGALSACRTRFRREAVIGARLGRDTGFVRAFDWGELGDGMRLYLAMDLVEEGRPLDLRSGALSARLGRLAQVAELVARAHAQGVVHRDLKPANVLTDPEGGLHLADFGLGKLLDEEQGSLDLEVTVEELTHTGAFMGTPAYMPPEQFEDAKRTDERADVYALGVMLFVALTGEQPYQVGPNPLSVLAAQQKVLAGGAPPPRPREREPDVPAGLDELCCRALELDMEARLASAAEFCATLVEEAGLDPPPGRASGGTRRLAKLSPGADAGGPDSGGPDTGGPASTRADREGTPPPGPVDPNAPTLHMPPPEGSLEPPPRPPGLPSVKFGLGLLVAMPILGMVLVAVLVSRYEPPGAIGGDGPPPPPVRPKASKTADPNEPPDGEQPDGEQPDGGPPGEPVWEEDFEAAALGAGWEVLRPDPTHWAVAGGHLVIVTRHGGQWFTEGDGGAGTPHRELGRVPNLVLQRAPVGLDDYRVEVDVTFQADQAGQAAGLLLYAGEGDFVSLTYSAWSWGDNVSWGFEFTKAVGGQLSHEVWRRDTGPMPEDETWRLALEVRDGITYQAFAGKDWGKGIPEWESVARVSAPTLPARELRVGLLGTCGRPVDAETDAVFDALRVLPLD